VNDRTELIRKLADWGPGALDSPVPADAAWAHVRELTHGHYENFSVLTKLVPKNIRDDFAAVYAFCRWSDDLADETGNDEAARERSIELLRWWREGLSACFASAHGEGDSDLVRHPVFVALRETATRHTLSDAPFHHLIDAFVQDQRVTEYRTWDDVLGYCKLSADPVGRIVLALSGIGDGVNGPAEIGRASCRERV